MNDHTAPNNINDSDHETLTKSERLFRALANCAPHGILYTDTNGRCIYSNDRLQSLVGRTAEELLDFGWINSVPPEDLNEFTTLFTTLEGPYDPTVRRVHEHRVTTNDDRIIWVSTSVAAVSDGSEDDIGWVATIEDITERKFHEHELSRLARQDPLTGLPNRYMLNQHLTQLCGSLIEGEVAAVAVIDLDRFKLVNDSFGHETGDELLKEVARLLRVASRRSDLIARLGGDEFAVVARLNDVSQAQALGQRLSDALHCTIETIAAPIHLAGSIGIATSSGSSLSPADLLRDADTAMYRAKRSRGQTVQIFDSSFRAEVTRRFDLETELRTAVEQDLISLEFQPVVDSDTHRIVSIEALARWHSASLGTIGPDEFIPIAEELGLIGHLGTRILEQACAQVAHWQTNTPCLPNLVVSVNLSPLQLCDPAFPETMKRILDRHHLAPQSLMLEITEGALLMDLEQATAALVQIREIGAQVALDDFGTGYSSLAYLNRLPVDYLKIDKSFVDSMDDIDDPTNSTRLARTIVDLAHRFNLTPVAEGVETEHQRQSLRDMGCGLVQGYVLARPMAADDPELQAILANGHSRGETAHDSNSTITGA